MNGLHSIPKSITTVYLQADVDSRMKIDYDYVPFDNRFVRNHSIVGNIEILQTTVKTKHILTILSIPEG